MNIQVSTVANPFKDQFLKKGLVTKKQVNKATHDQRLTVSKKAKKGESEEDGVRSRAQQAMEEQAARDRERNRLQNEAAREKEIQAQIRQIIKQNRIEVRGDIPYHFADDKKIQRLHVGKAVVDSLSKGALAIVKEDEQYFVVPAKAALQIRERNAQAVLLLNAPAHKPLAADDPYAEFPIPDDYEW